MSPVITLMRREWWEYRSAFFYIPLILTILLVCLALAGLLGVMIFSVNITELPPHWQAQLKPEAVPLLCYGLGVVAVVVLWITILSYFWSCLFNDRKDGSIWFWQSMPVSQTQMISAKLLVGLVMVPLIWWVWLVIAEFLLLVIIGIAMKLMGVAAWPLVWQPGVIVLTWVTMLVATWVQGLWLFPLVGWLMLCSAYAKRAPLLIALILPIVIIAIEYFIRMHSYLYELVRTWFFSLVETWRYFFDVVNQYMGNPVSSPGVINLENIIFGILVGIVFLIFAGLLRDRGFGVER